MFTGIVEELGTVRAVAEKAAAGSRIEIACSEVLRDAAVGASIAINGACVTAVELSTKFFAADLAPET
jgi:riboflavin synthase